MGVPPRVGTKVESNLKGWQLLKCFVRDSLEVEHADLELKSNQTSKQHFNPLGMVATITVISRKKYASNGFILVG